MKDGPAFQLYAADFYMDTVGWSPTEVGVYFRLLMYEWVNGSIPNDKKMLARIAGIDQGNFNKLWSLSGKGDSKNEIVPPLGGKFVPTPQGELINLRLEETRKKQEEYRERQAKAARGGVEAKRKKGIFPFDKSTHGLSQGSTHTSTRNQALQSSSSFKEETSKEESKRDYTECIKATNQVCKDLSLFYKDKRMFYQIRQGWMNQQCHPDAISYCLNAAWEQREGIRSIRGFLKQIMDVEGQNITYNEAVVKHEGIKKEMDDIIRGLTE